MRPTIKHMDELSFQVLHTSETKAQLLAKLVWYIQLRLAAQ